MSSVNSYKKSSEKWCIPKLIKKKKKNPFLWERDGLVQCFKEPGYGQQGVPWRGEIGREIKAHNWEKNCAEVALSSSQPAPPCWTFFFHCHYYRWRDQKLPNQSRNIWAQSGTILHHWGRKFKDMDKHWLIVQI